MPIPKHDDLKAIPKRERFLEELRDHCEDACEERVGNIEVNISTFNMYAKEYIRKATIRVILVAIIVAIWSSVATYIVFNGPSEHGGVSTPVALAVLPGWCFAAPVMFAGVIAGLLTLIIFSPTADTVQVLTEQAIWIVPLLTTVLWTSVAYILQFNPPKFLHRLSKTSAKHS